MADFICVKCGVKHSYRFDGDYEESGAYRFNARCPLTEMKFCGECVNKAEARMYVRELDDLGYTIQAGTGSLKRKREDTPEIFAKDAKVSEAWMQDLVKYKIVEPTFWQRPLDPDRLDTTSHRDGSKTCLKYRNGRIVETFTLDEKGDRQGVAVTEFEDGSSVLEHFVDGIPCGACEEFWPNKKLRSKGINNKDGDPMGVWEIFDEDGERIETKRYDVKSRLHGEQEKDGAITLYNHGKLVKSK